VDERDREVSGCTFKPKMTAKPHDMPLEVLPRGATRNEALYARGLADRERKEARKLQDEAARSKNEVKDCTFKPDTGKSNTSYCNRANDGSAPVPRGFYENKQRLRGANEVLAKKREQREDRLCKITQVGKINLASSTASASNAPAVLGEQLQYPLPPVSEDSRLQDVTRPKVAAKASTPRGTRSPQPRSSSGSRGTPGRNGAERARTASPADTTGSARRTPGGGSRSPERLQGTPNTREASLVGLMLAGREEGSSPNPAPAQFGTPAAAPSSTALSPDPAEADVPPLLYVDVNIAPNQPPERIVLREGQSVTEVAAEFAAKHVLTPALAQRLHALLREVLQRQEQQQQQR